MKKSMLRIMAAVAAGLFASQAQALFEARNLQAVAAGDGLDVTWDHPQEEYTRISYDISAYPLGQGIVPLEGSSFETSESFRGLTPGTDYQIVVTSFAQTQGVSTTTDSNGVTTIGRTSGARPFAPDAPNPTCTFADGSLTVTWPAVRYATGYESSLRSGARDEGGGTDLGSRAATTRTWSGELQSETTYFVDVRTVNSSATAAARNSGWGVCSFTTPPEPQTPTPPEPETPTPPEPETPTPPEPETPTPPEPETPTPPEVRLCTYEHRLGAVPSETQSYTGWIRVTSRVANRAVRIRAYHSEDGRSLDMVDDAGEAVGSTTRLGPANSTRRFRIQDGVTGWHSVVVAHGITADNGMNGVTVSMMVRGGPQGLQFFSADVVEHCTVD